MTRPTASAGLRSSGMLSSGMPFAGMLVAALLAVVQSPAAFAASATDTLLTLDSTTWNGRITAVVERYAAPGKDGGTAPPERLPAQVVFERPDRYRVSLHPGTQDEYRAVAEAGVVRWQDAGSGLSGKTPVEQVTDPLALALLGTAGELKAYAALKDQPGVKGAPVSGARLLPRSGHGGMTSGDVWLSSEGEPIGFEFRFVDGGKVIVSIVRFERNIALDKDDFTL